MLIISGCKSFQDIRTIDEKVYETFKGAAVALKLVKDENQWQKCLDEAITQETDISKIRFLFATICMHCNPTNPDAAELWANNVNGLILDFIRKGDTQEQAITKALKVNI